MLDDGDILMYGGMGNQEGYSDFWIINTAQWSWLRATITGAPKQARAGATCELVGKNQVMVIGGKREESMYKWNRCGWEL